MPRKPRDRANELLRAQAGAREFALDYLGRVPLGLPETLDEDAFAKVMTAVTQGLVAAYAAGFFACAESKP